MLPSETHKQGLRALRDRRFEYELKLSDFRRSVQVWENEIALLSVAEEEMIERLEKVLAKEAEKNCPF